MNGVVIPAPDFEAKPCFEFSQGKGGVLLTVIPPARFDIRPSFPVRHVSDA
jgi:hypothetical protein